MQAEPNLDLVFLTLELPATSELAGLGQLLALSYHGQAGSYLNPP